VLVDDCSPHTSANIPALVCKLAEDVRLLAAGGLVLFAMFDPLMRTSGRRVDKGLSGWSERRWAED